MLWLLDCLTRYQEMFDMRMSVIDLFISSDIEVDVQVHEKSYFLKLTDVFRISVSILRSTLDGGCAGEIGVGEEYEAYEGLDDEEDRLHDGFLISFLAKGTIS